jgi:hypothetical protein
MTDEREIWRGRQWAVTSQGLHAPGESYCIEACRLGEVRASRYSDWMLHMAEKDWVDVDDFVTAWCVAVAVHRTPLTGIDVAGSIKKTWAEKARYEEWDRAHPSGPGGWHFHGA